MKRYLTPSAINDEVSSLNSRAHRAAAGGLRRELAAAKAQLAGRDAELAAAKAQLAGRDAELAMLRAEVAELEGGAGGSGAGGSGAGGSGAGGGGAGGGGAGGSLAGGSGAGSGGAGGSGAGSGGAGGSGAGGAGAGAASTASSAVSAIPVESCRFEWCRAVLKAQGGYVLSFMNHRRVHRGESCMGEFPRMCSDRAFSLSGSGKNGFVWLEGGKHTWALEHDGAYYTIMEFISVAGRDLLLAGKRPLRLQDAQSGLGLGACPTPCRLLVDVDMNTRTFCFRSEQGEIFASGAVPDPCYFAVYTKLAGGRFVLVQ
jgi:hypothetical protein